MLHVLKLHSLYSPPGGDSSGCIEVYASCVKAAFSPRVGFSINLNVGAATRPIPGGEEVASEPIMKTEMCDSWRGNLINTTIKKVETLVTCFPPVGLENNS